MFTIICVQYYLGFNECALIAWKSFDCLESAGNPK